MFGYACNETPELMPAPIFYAHAILRSLVARRGMPARRRCSAPTAKSQVTLQYVDGKPVRRDQGRRLDPACRRDRHRTRCARSCRPYVLNALPEGWMCDEEHFLVNPTGRFVIGGPDGDAGVTGRKIIVDTYGGCGAAWRRRVLRQGPDQGRPLGRLCRALSGQERRRRRPRRALHDPGRLCDRRRQAAVVLCRHRRRGRRGQARRVSCRS